MKVLERMRVHTNTIEPEATVRDAVDMMDLYQMTTLPVVDRDGRPIGIVTESDIEDALLIPFAAVAAMASPGRDAELSALSERIASLPVETVMTAPAASVDEHTDVLEAASLMLARGFKRLPVTSEGRLVGIVSRIDICQAILDILLQQEDLRDAVDT